jgi:flagellar hook-associated protein 2
MYTVYNDKQMATEYSSYKTKISDMEDTISTKEDYYYKLFSKMEKAMAEANSQQSTLSSYLR